MRSPRLLAAGLLGLVALGAPATVPAAAGSVPLSTAGPFLDDLGRQAVDASRPEAERIELINLLGQWASPRVRERLLAALADPAPAVRQAAARALGWAGNVEASPALRERVLAPGEAPEVRAAAVAALGKIGDTAVREVVLGTVTDPEARVREAAFGALALGALASPTDRVPLLRRLAEDRALDPWMRSEAIRQLAAVRDTGSADLLMRLLASEPTMAMPVPRPDATQQDVMALRHRQVRDVRAWAAAALGHLEARQALPLLLAAAEDPGDFFLRVISMQVLITWNPAEARGVFLRRVDDPLGDVRALAISALARAGEQSAAPAMVIRLSDPEPAVRVAAVRALVEFQHPETRAILENHRRRESDSSVQQAIEAALTRLGS